MRRVFDSAGPMSRLALSPRIVLPSLPGDEVGAPDWVITELNGWPACSPVNAYDVPLRPRRHDSGPWWVATAFHVRLFHPLLHAGLSRRFLLTPFLCLFFQDAERPQSSAKHCRPGVAGDLCHCLTLYHRCAARTSCASGRPRRCAAFTHALRLPHRFLDPAAPRCRRHLSCGSLALDRSTAPPGLATCAPQVARRAPLVALVPARHPGASASIVRVADGRHPTSVPTRDMRDSGSLRRLACGEQPVRATQLQPRP